MGYCLLLVWNKQKTSFGIQYQNQASKPNKSCEILKSEVVSFNLISSRSVMVWLVKGNDCSKLVLEGEVQTQLVFLVRKLTFCYVEPMDRVLNPCSNLWGHKKVIFTTFPPACIMQWCYIKIELKSTNKPPNPFDICIMNPFVHFGLVSFGWGVPLGVWFDNFH